MMRSVKVRLRPTRQQERLLWQSAGVCRFAYNWTLAQQQENHEKGGNFLNDGILRKRFTLLKKTEEYQWLYNTSNNVPKQAIKDACKAYIRFFEKKSCHPRFKSKKKSKPSFYNDSMKLKFKEDRFLIEKIGWVLVSEPMRIPTAKFYNPRITHDGKYWYIGLCFDSIPEPTTLSDESLGIDVGIKDLAICSNGQTFKNINKTAKIRKIEKKLHRLQRQVSRKYLKNKKGKEFVKTRNIIKTEKKVKLVFRKMKNIRQNHIHQTTTAIVKTKPCRIVAETLNISGMLKNKHLSKSIASQNLFFFKTTLKYKCENYGIEFVQADLFFPSSKLCSVCGNIKKDLKLKDRIYKCSFCENTIDRDFQASINLSRYKVSKDTQNVF